tara:strand:+ start:58 stop:1023 length:966 start_codon:yes stop_codon:yes gene_type:complete
METFTSKLAFLRQIFGEPLEARDGINVAFKCPVCNESNKKKLSINIENWSCHCWVCGTKGRSPYSIIYKHVSKEYANIFKSRFLNNKSFNTKINVAEIEEKVKLPDGFIPLCTSLKTRDPDIRDCISYLKSREIRLNDMWYFKIGATQNGRLRRRVIIPSFDDEGHLNYFSARAIDKTSRINYINSKVKKTDIIFNELNIDWKKEVTIVEGPFDLFKCDQNATCMLGSTLRLESRLFRKLVANSAQVVLALDSDMKEKTIKIANRLLEYSCDVRILDLGEFNDVGEMTKKEFLDAKKNAKPWNVNKSLKHKISVIRTGSIF